MWPPSSVSSIACWQRVGTAAAWLDDLDRVGGGEQAGAKQTHGGRLQEDAAHPAGRQQAPCDPQPGGRQEQEKACEREFGPVEGRAWCEVQRAKRGQGEAGGELERS